MLGARLITAACNHSYHAKSHEGWMLAPPHAATCWFLKQVPRPMPFISFSEPALPKLRAFPPAGDGWLHEFKFDGRRVQLCKPPNSKSGRDFRGRIPGLMDAVAALPARSCIIDGELTAFGVTRKSQR